MKSVSYGVYLVRFYAGNEHIDSLPVFAETAEVIRFSIESAPNVPAGTKYSVYLLGLYNKRTHQVKNRCKMLKVLSGEKPSSNHSKAAEAATPERVVNETSNCGKAD